MNILIDGLPSGYGGLKLFTDYRNWMKFELSLQDNSISEEEKGIRVLETTIKSDLSSYAIEDLEYIIDIIMWFYSCGKHEETKETEEEKDFKKPNKLIYSFEHDAEYIYSAFLECYGIDLVEENMHWWKFKALLKSLNDKCLFSKILGYRSIKISSKMSKEEKEFYREMQKLYKLPDGRTEEEKESDFANSLFASM